MPTDSEIIASLKTDWSSNDYYNFEDMNRVEEATRIVKDRIQEYYKTTVTLDIITTRNVATIDFAQTFNRVESNIYELMQALPDGLEAKMEEVKTNWAANMPFSFDDANRLERNLLTMYKYVTGNQANIPYCGQYVAGQQGVY